MNKCFHIDIIFTLLKQLVEVKENASSSNISSSSFLKPRVPGTLLHVLLWLYYNVNKNKRKTITSSYFLFLTLSLQMVALFGRGTFRQKKTCLPCISNQTEPMNPLFSGIWQIEDTAIVTVAVHEVDFFTSILNARKAVCCRH